MCYNIRFFIAMVYDAVFFINSIKLIIIVFFRCFN